MADDQVLNDAASRASPPPVVAGAAPVGNGLLIWLMLAHVGANLAFMPVLSIILPMRVLELTTGDPSRAFALILFAGAATASAATIVMGAASDRTRTRWGRRRPWMLIGIPALSLSYAGIAFAGSLAALLVAVIAFQAAVGILFAPLMAVMPDRVGDGERGRVSGAVALGNPLGSFAGAALVALVPGGAWAQLAAIVMLVGALILPLVINYRDEPAASGKQGHSSRTVANIVPDPRRGDRVRVWLIRLLVVFALNLLLGYMLFYLTALGKGPWTGDSTAAGLAWLLAVAAAAQIAGALAAGWMSDRAGAIRGFALLSIALIGIATALLLINTGAALLIAIFVTLGLGHGVFQAMDMALVTQILRGDSDSGRGMGLMNLANTFPQLAAPALAWILGEGAGFQPLFAAAGLALVLAVVPLATLRTIR